MQSQIAEITHDDLRALRARYNVPVYILAARARIHPVRVSRLLNGRSPLTPELATRLQRAIEAEAATK